MMLFMFGWRLMESVAVVELYTCTCKCACMYAYTLDSFLHNQRTDKEQGGHPGFPCPGPRALIFKVITKDIYKRSNYHAEKPLKQANNFCLVLGRSEPEGVCSALPIWIYSMAWMPLVFGALLGNLDASIHV